MLTFLGDDLDAIEFCTWSSESNSRAQAYERSRTIALWFTSLPFRLGPLFERPPLLTLALTVDTASEKLGQRAWHVGCL
jgi:hypothetical protein